MKSNTLFQITSRDQVNIGECKRKILTLTQQEKDRGPIPGADFTFPEENFAEFKVRDSQNRLLKLTIFRASPKNSETPKGILFLLHGLGSHSNRMAHLATPFVEKGFVVVAFDHRGVAKSEGLQGLIESHHHLYDDSFEFMDFIDKLYDKKIKRFAMGQSMGGMIAMNVAIRRKDYFSGIILLAPALKDRKEYLPFLKKIAKIMGCLIPRIPLTKPRYNDSCRNPEIANNIMNDKLAYKGGMRPGTARNILVGMDYNYPFMKNLETPFLVFQGGCDKVVDLEGAFELLEISKSDDKTLYFSEEMWHDLAHEDDVDEIGRISVDWALKRV